MSRTLSIVQEYLACTGQDYLGEVGVNDLSMEVGVGPARYGDYSADFRLSKAGSHDRFTSSAFHLVR